MNIELINNLRFFFLQFPKVGELLVKRLIIQFRRTYQRNDKANCINTVRFIAHLINQSMVYELLALEILMLLLENATNDSVEVAIAFLKECGAKLDDVARKATAAIFETLRNILHDAELEKRVQYMIEVMFAVRKDKFKDHPSILPELDLVEEADQFTHPLELLDDYDSEDKLNVFQFDPNFQENESKYEIIKKGIIGNDSDSGESGDSGSDSNDESSDDSDDEDAGGDPGLTGTTNSTVIIDNTETNMIAFRKTVYLTIQSSLDFEECAHKLLKLNVNEAQVPELCNMIVDCCAQQRTYIKFFGLLAQRFCQLNNEYVSPFEDIFRNAYDTIHRFETCKLRNVAKLFAHMLHTDAIPWTVLSHIRLNENDTSSSSRVFIKILFQQLAESLGLVKLNGRIKDPTLQSAFEGLFPRDEPQNTRFAINFFTSIGLGGLTDDLREHLKTAATKQPPTLGLESLAKNVKKEETSSSSSSSSDSSSSSSSSSDSSSSSSEDSSSENSEDNHKGKHKSRSSSHKSRTSQHKSRSSQHNSHSSRHKTRKYSESPDSRDKKRRRH